MDQEPTASRSAILIAAAVIASPRLKELKDSPALRAAIQDAIRVAEFMARVLARRSAPVGNKP